MIKVKGSHSKTDITSVIMGDTSYSIGGFLGESEIIKIVTTAHDDDGGISVGVVVKDDSGPNGTELYTIPIIRRGSYTIILKPEPIHAQKKD